MLIGPAIKQARKATGRSRDEVAAAAGVSPRAAANLENGTGSLPVLQAIADQIDFRIAGLARGHRIAQQVASARSRDKLSVATLARKAKIAESAVRNLEVGLGHIRSLEAVIPILAPKARTRKSERANWNKGSRDDRHTPEWLLALITDVFGPISLDPCASMTKRIEAERHITEAEDGLAAAWNGKTVFVNPPFSQAALWIRKAWQEWHHGHSGTVIALLPVRTNASGFHDYVAGQAKMIFLRGTPRFGAPDRGAALGGIAYGVMLAVWGGDDQLVQQLASELSCTMILTGAVQVFSSSRRV
ncbi:DNA N-6-adenine-methyltransferase [Sphingomonas sp. RB1R13]|uniref:DNA N-6-adenine-methyltransferase n=1 Tax=Sphingomonas sp. RB1R13 TaxID=3096159 RepID=UPI002FC6D4DE